MMFPELTPPPPPPQPLQGTKKENSQQEPVLRQGDKRCLSRHAEYFLRLSTFQYCASFRGEEEETLLLWLLSNLLNNYSVVEMEGVKGLHP